tara:strand:+ start:2187 stop:2627 length:441 start_codon:yes stop_codon:yes gene_type:complete
MDKREVSNIFGWLDEITLKKSHPDTFSESSWDKWNSYMVHRYVSMNLDYIDIVNYVQKISPQNKKQIYTIYKEMIPKRKLWLKYIKSQNKNNYQELSEYISKYYECSIEESNQYITILEASGVEDILSKMGVDEKESKKIIKKAKL